MLLVKLLPVFLQGLLVTIVLLISEELFEVTLGQGATLRLRLLQGRVFIGLST